MKAAAAAVCAALVLAPALEIFSQTAAGPADIADLMPPGGEMNAKDSVYDRWAALAGEPGSAAAAAFIERNFVVRDGALVASGSPAPGTRITVEAALERMAGADVVFFGEQHNQAGAHLLEILLLRLLDRRNGADVCMEMFETQSQGILDEYMSGAIDEKKFTEKLEAPEIRGLWQNYRKDYRPVVEYAKSRGLRLAAGFPPRRLANDLARKGEEAFYKALPESDRKLCASKLTEPADPSYRQRCMDAFAGAGDVRRAQLLAMAEKEPAMLKRFKPMILGTGGPGGAPRGMMSGDPEPLWKAQLLKDSTMAETIRAMIAAKPGRKIFAVAGAGHVSYMGGAAGVLAALCPSLKIATVVFDAPRTSPPEEKPGPAAADILILGDRIDTYVQELPEAVTVEAARKRVAELEALALLAAYRSNGGDQMRAMAEIEKARSLKFKFPVCPRIMTEEESRAEVSGWSRGAEAEAELALREKALRAFKLHASQKPLAEIQAEKSAESVMGFYRPSEKVLYLFPEQAGERLWGLRVHETIHALQDQHFDLQALHASVRDSDDDAALTALIEGEAVYLMMQVLGGGDRLDRMLQGGGQGHPRAPGSGPPPAPDYHGERTKLVYRAGAQFVKHLVDAGGWEKVTEAFRRRPGTTSEILHPSLWMEGWKRSSPRLPAVREGWKELLSDTLGEADFSIMLKLNGVPEDEAAAAASAWRSDRYRIEASDAGTRLERLIYVSTWSDEDAAARASSMLGRVFPDARISAKDLICAMVREMKSGRD